MRACACVCVRVCVGGGGLDADQFLHINEPGRDTYE